MQPILNLLAVVILVIICGLCVACGRVEQAVTVVQDGAEEVHIDEPTSSCQDLNKCQLYWTKQGHRVFKCK